MQTTLVDGKRVVKSTAADRNAVKKSLDVFDFVAATHQDPDVRTKAAAALEAGQAIQKALAAGAAEEDEQAPPAAAVPPADAPTPAAPPPKEPAKKGTKAADEAATAK